MMSSVIVWEVDGADASSARWIGLAYLAVLTLTGTGCSPPRDAAHQAGATSKLPAQPATPPKALAPRWGGQGDAGSISVELSHYNQWQDKLLSLRADGDGGVRLGARPTCSYRDTTLALRRLGRAEFLDRLLATAQDRASPPGSAAALPATERDAAGLLRVVRKELKVTALGRSMSFDVSTEPRGALLELQQRFEAATAGALAWESPAVIALLDRIRDRMQPCLKSLASAFVSFEVDPETGRPTGTKASSPDVVTERCLLRAAESQRFPPVAPPTCRPELSVHAVSSR
jgi:hypothetical protein